MGNKLKFDAISNICAKKQTKKKNKGPEWAASYVLEDHMAMVCGGVWAVVSSSVPLSGVKGLGGRGVKGDYVYTRSHSRFQITHKHTPPEHNSISPVSLQFHP